MMSNEHNEQSEDCILTQIQDLAESCDNEYYVSAMVSPMQN